MQAQFIEAAEPQARVFSHVYAVQQPLGSPTIHQQLLPNYEMLLITNFGSPLSGWLGDSAYTVKRTAVVGPLQKLLRYNLVAGTDLFVIVFTLNGFYRLFGKMMSEQSQRSGMQVEPVFAEVIWQHMATTTFVGERFTALTDYVVQHVAPLDETMQSLFDTLPYFQYSAVDPIKAVAQQRQLSPRTLQLRFQHQLGYSAKEMTRFLRFKKLIEQLLDPQNAHQPDWSALVVSHDYHDQSHLIRDFQYFTGLTPTAFLKQRATQTMCISRPGMFY